MSNTKVTIFRHLPYSCTLEVLTFDSYIELQRFKEKFNERKERFILNKTILNLGNSVESLKEGKRQLEDIMTDWVWVAKVNTHYNIGNSESGVVYNE